MSKTHWKKAFNPNYLGAYSLEPGQELVVTIKSAGKQEIVGAEGRAEECLVAQLEKQKPLILNKTNAKAVAKVAGSNYLEDWAGVKIQLYVARVKAFGDTVDAIRVRDFAPKGREKLTQERFAKMLASIEAGKYSVDKALASFDLTNSQKGQLEAIKNQKTT